MKVVPGDDKLPSSPLPKRSSFTPDPCHPVLSSAFASKGSPFSCELAGVDSFFFSEQRKGVERTVPSAALLFFPPVIF